MPTPFWSPLLDAPNYPSDGFAPLADRIGALLGTKSDVVLVQGEAIVALEAVATSLARPGLVALNLVSSPYGQWFGRWLARAGASVTDLVAVPGLPITIAEFTTALDRLPDAKIVSLVHAESASGILNPLPEIAAICRARGLLLVVDAVASLGGHGLDADGLGLDIVVVGPQKSLGGSAGLSAVSVSARAWEMILSAGGPELSMLSLGDLKRQWLDTGRGVLPGTPSALEFWALQAALDRVEAEGMPALIARHELAALATRAGLQALGVPTWGSDGARSNLVTCVTVPDGFDVAQVLDAANQFGAALGPGVGPGTERLLRLNHTGPRSRFDVVLANVLALGQALQGLGHRVDIGGAAAAIAAIYAAGK